MAPNHRLQLKATAQGNAEPDCGKRTAEAQALSQKAEVRKHKQVSWSSRGSGQRSARSTPDLRQGKARAEHQQGAARPAQRARRKPDQGRPKAGELPAPQARTEAHAVKAQSVKRQLKTWQRAGQQQKKQQRPSSELAELGRGLRAKARS